MALRTSMLGLIDIVRSLINDRAGEQFDAEQVQIALDKSRVTHTYEVLEERETIASGGGVSYLNFESMSQWWEEDAQLFNSSFTLLSPSESDFMGGRWVFASAPRRPIYVSGKTYDPYFAAAELLEQWATKCALEFDFRTEGGASFSRSQKAKALQQAADTYRAKSMPRYADMARPDLY